MVWIVLVVYHNSVRSVLSMCSYSVTSVACVLLHLITTTLFVCVCVCVCVCLCMYVCMYVLGVVCVGYGAGNHSQSNIREDKGLTLASSY